MTGRTGKGQSKAKQGKEPVVVKGSITVRDCMTWRYQEGYDQAASGTPQPPSDHYLPTKADIGRAKSRGYDMQPTTQHNTHDEEGTVIDALRGWPHHRGDQEFGDDMDCLDPKGGAGTGAEIKPGGDPYMVDLMSHHFMQEAIRKRQEEEAAARRAAAAKAKKANPGKGDIKSNRTAQLRAIAMAEKVEVKPQDLWQMPKFKGNARPHLTTTTKRAQDKGGNRSRGGSATPNGYDATGNGDPCTCYDNDPTLFDGGRDSIQHQYQYDGPANAQLDDYAYGDENDDKLFAV